MTYAVVATVAVLIAFTTIALSITTLVHDTSSLPPVAVLAVSQAGGASSATMGSGGAVLSSGVATHEIATMIKRNFSVSDWGTTFHGRSWFTRAGDMRFLQITIDESVPDSVTTRLWLIVKWQPLGMTPADLPRITPSSMRQQCYFLVGGLWYHGILRLHSNGEIYIRMLGVDDQSGLLAVWIAANLVATPNVTVGVPSAFIAWTVAAPSPHGLRIERAPGDPIVPVTA